MNFHQKLVVYYILDYFGILFILDLNSVLREFILWDQRLLKGFILRISRTCSSWRGDHDRCSNRDL